MRLNRRGIAPEMKNVLGREVNSTIDCVEWDYDINQNNHAESPAAAGEDERDGVAGSEVGKAFEAEWISVFFVTFWNEKLANFRIYVC